MDIRKLARQCVLGRKEYVPGKPVAEVQRELGITDIIKMASNENPLGSSPMALAAMIEELKNNANRYPDSICYELREKLAVHHGVSPENVFIDNGLDGVITMIGLTFLNPQDENIFGALSFAAYENIATKMGSVCVPIPMTPQHGLDIDGFISAITPRTKVIWLCNPNNPTGTFTTKKDFERLLKATPEHALLVCDEAYYEFADDPKFPQTLGYLEKHPNLIILRTFSKIMGLAGLRVGYALAHQDVVNVMLKSREPFPVNIVAQAGAVAGMDDTDFINRTLDVNRKGRAQYYRAFDKMGVKYCPTQTNFIFIDLERPAQPVFQAMLRDGVIVRSLAFVGAPNGIRITIGLKEENERTIASLRKALQNP
jgi:histidinol-phosphate aminotransferase